VSRSLARHGAIADVAAALHAVPRDRVHQPVARRCASLTVAPMAVAQSTRPPLVTTRPSRSAVPAWKTLSPSQAADGRPEISSPLR